MNRLLFARCALVLAVMVLVAACSKNNSFPPLPAQVKKTARWSKEGNLLKISASILVKDVQTDIWQWTTYEYDAAFNLVRSIDSIQELSKEGYIIDGKTGSKRTERIFGYTNNRLSSVTYIDSSYPVTQLSYNAKGQLTAANNAAKNFAFSYSSTGDTVSSTITYLDGLKKITLNKYYLSGGNLQKSEQYDLTNGGNNLQISFTYNSYDQNKTPLDLLPLNSITRLFLATEPEAWKNNVLDFSYAETLGGTQGSRSYAYQYNTSGFPYQVDWFDTYQGVTHTGGSHMYFYTNR